MKFTFIDLFQMIVRLSKEQTDHYKGKMIPGVKQQSYHSITTKSVTGKSSSVCQTSIDPTWHTPNETSKVILVQIVPFLLQRSSKFLDIGRMLLTLT